MTLELPEYQTAGTFSGLSSSNSLTHTHTQTDKGPRPMIFLAPVPHLVVQDTPCPSSMQKVRNSSWMREEWSLEALFTTYDFVQAASNDSSRNTLVRGLFPVSERDCKRRHTGRGGLSPFTLLAARFSRANARLSAPANSLAQPYVSNSAYQVFGESSPLPFILQESSLKVLGMSALGLAGRGKLSKWVFDRDAETLTPGSQHLPCETCSGQFAWHHTPARKYRRSHHGPRH